MCIHAEAYMHVHRCVNIVIYSKYTLFYTLALRLWLPNQNILSVCIAWKMTKRRQLESLATCVALLTNSM